MKQVIILDGGMGQELLSMAKTQPTKLWSAQFMLDNPELVQQVHTHFLNAGAQVITLNTYTATPTRFARDGDINLLADVYAKALQAALGAKSAYPKTRIAGCLPPLEASYVSPHKPILEKCIEEYRQLVKWQAPVDLFLIETMTHLIEAEAALIAAQESGKPVWVAFSVSDKHHGELRQGSLLKDAIALATKYQASAVLLNCSNPEAIDTNLELLTSFNGQIGAYANGFVNVDALQPGGTVAKLQKRHNLGPEEYLTHVQRWITAGLTIIGGCCEIGPAHIQAVSHWVNMSSNRSSEL